MLKTENDALTNWNFVIDTDYKLRCLVSHDSASFTGCLYLIKTYEAEKALHSVLEEECLPSRLVLLIKLVCTSAVNTNIFKRYRHVSIFSKV